MKLIRNEPSQRWLRYKTRQKDHKFKPFGRVFFKLISADLRKMTGEKWLWVLIAILFCINGAYAIFNSVRSANDAWDYSHTVDTYPASIQRIIDSAYVNLHEYEVAGISEDSYAWRYQKQLIQQYEKAQQCVCFTESSVRGWTLYFEDHTVDILLFLAVILVGSTIFLNDQRSGFYCILQTTKHGRLHSAVAKTVVWILLTTGLTAAFTAQSFGIYGIRSGYSDPHNAIQILDGFNTCPYTFTFGEYFLFSFGFRLLAMLVMTAFCVLVSQLVRHVVMLTLCGIGFLGCNLILYTLQVYTADDLLKHLNLIAVSSALPLVSRYHACSLFDHVIDFPTLAIVVYGIVLLAAMLASILVPNWSPKWVSGYHRDFHMGSQKSIFSKIRAKVVAFGKKRNTVWHTYSFSLVSVEQIKIFLTSYTWIAVCLLLLIKCYASYVEFKPNYTFTDVAYHGYMTQLQGAITEEKRAWIQKERLYIEDILACSDEVDAAYQNLEISLAEYQEFMEQREYAASRQELFKTIENHVRYIDEMRQNGYEAWFVYDTGWTMLFFSDFDWTLYAVLLLLGVGCFASEYDSRSSSGGFIQILRTTKYGRKKTYIAKLFACIRSSVLCTTIWNLIDFIWVYTSYDLPLPNAPIHSIEAFGSWKPDMTIAAYLLCLYVVRIFAGILFSVLVCALSGILKKHIAIIASTVILTLLPSLLSHIGLRVFAYFDFTKLMQASAVLLQGNQSIGFVLATVMLMLLLLIIAERKWCHGNCILNRLKT